MKISKLFHWLYALIMFLPVFFWIPTAFYYGFNEHATNPSTTDVQINYKYQSNEVNSIDDLTIGNIYYVTMEDGTLDSYWSMTDDSYILFQVITTLDYDFQNYTPSIDDFILEGNGQNYPVEVLGKFYDAFEFDLYIQFANIYEGNDYLTSTYFGALDSDDFTFNFICKIIDFEGIEDLQPGVFNYTTYNEIENVDIVETEGISNAMYQSWQDVWTLPMFSWTHDTFFSAPFNYIAGLFGIQAGNTLSYCLSYWFSISIIWLVFDLMIYVPLLVHRWLDKAGIQ